MKSSTKWIVGLIVLAAAVFFVYRITGNVVAGDGKLDDFAKCVSASGAKMYGAYWCSHCQNQKKEFGSSFDFVNYIECDPKGDGANPSACSAAGISGYPTWIFGDGTSKAGEVPLQELALRTGCELPA